MVGVPRGRFLRTLRGNGQVFGIKFKAGGFRAFVDAPVSRFTNRSVSLTTVLAYGARLADDVLGAATDTAMVECADAREQSQLRLRLQAV